MWHVKDPRYLLTLSWIALLILSIATVWVRKQETAFLASMIVLVLGFFKAWIIIDRFMELHSVALHWRLLMLSWPSIMTLCIGIGLFL